jgi:hypothetical protein
MPPTIYPTGVTIHLPELAYDTLVLFDGRDSSSYLIDSSGDVVRSWNYKGFPSEMIAPELTGGRKGHIFVQKEDALFGNETLLELDWEGRAIWEWGKNAPNGKAAQAWDQARLPSGNTLVLALHSHRPCRLGGAQINDQAIYEVTRAGDVAWSWIASDHLDQLGFDSEKAEFLLRKAMPRRPSFLEINNMHPVGPNRHFDAGDERFAPDNIMIDSRCGNVVAIIEKSSSRITWRIGPDYPAARDYAKKTFTGSVPRPLDAISGQHDAHMIPLGAPGAGNILLFDNQGSAGITPFYSEFLSGSRVLEIDPLTNEIVWQYDASSGGRDYWTFHSCFISSARRLPNGNTLICEGMYGRIFQVTPSGEIVWEYINPHFGTFVTHGVPTGGAKSNWIFRAQPVPHEWVPDFNRREACALPPIDVSQYRINSA